MTTAHSFTPDFLVRIDRLLAELQSGARAPGAPLAHELSRLVLLAAGVDEREWASDPVAGVFAQARDTQTRWLTTVCFLRFLGVNRQFLDSPEFKRRALKLFDETIPEAVNRWCKISPKDQTYERERALGDAIPALERRLRAELAAFTSLDQLQALRSDFIQAMVNQVNRFLLSPFLPPALADRKRLNALFAAVDRYHSSSVEDRLRTKQSAVTELINFRDDAASFGTTFSRDFLGGLAVRLREVVEADFASSPYNRPARLVLEPTAKRYPLQSVGTRFDVRLVVRNEGEGQAAEAAVMITDVPAGIEIPTRTSFLGSIAPGEQIGDLRIQATVAASQTTSALGVELRWLDPDGTDQTRAFSHALTAQRSALDWASLATAEPYELGPVPTADQLAGRREILDRLVAKCTGANVGSVVLHGQRRVGKTSIARVLLERLRAERNAPLALFLESGEYIRETAALTVQHLGIRLCEDIRSLSPELSDLAIPAFGAALSPLTDFMRSALRRLPSLRLVLVLDEFDVLPLELFKRGQVGDAFFATIRSLSGNGRCGFVLVGGENMELLLSNQGQALNKFAYERVDYFNREQDWSDYEDLVKHPTKDQLEFTDPAIVHLFEATAGNPFFTKLVCAQIFQTAVRRRDSHVTDREAREGVAAAIRSAGSNKFQHFWEDGIFARGELQEDVSLRRRKVLLAFAEAVRARKRTTEAIVAKGSGPDLGESVIRRELKDLERRKILRSEGVNVFCVVPLFEEWLRDRGVFEIITTVTDQDAFVDAKRREEEARIQPSEIVELVKRWTPYKGRAVGEERVRAWLEQFDGVEAQRTMFHLLSFIDYYNDDVVRARLHAVHSTVERELVRQGIPMRTVGRQRKRDDVALSYFSSDGKSGAHFARSYSDENGIYVERVVHPSRIEEELQAHPEVRALIVVDDFVGTGSTAVSGLRSLPRPLVRKLADSKFPVVLVAVCGFTSGLQGVAKTGESLGLNFHVFAADTLGSEKRCFSAESLVFPDLATRTHAEEIARSYGARLVPKNPLGFGDGQALVVFDRQCPNNSLPILWKQTKEWTALFPRDM